MKIPSAVRKAKYVDLSYITGGNINGIATLKNTGNFL